MLVWIAQGNNYVQVQKIASPSIYITFGQGAQSIFLNRPGTVAIIGDTGTGVSYVYSMNSSNLFTLVSGNLTQYNTSIAVQFGASVAASDDITHSIHSGQLYNNEGAVWFFGVQSAAITQSPTLSNSTASPTTRSSAVDLLQCSILSWFILSFVVMNSCF